MRDRYEFCKNCGGTGARNYEETIYLGEHEITHQKKKKCKKCGGTGIVDLKQKLRLSIKDDIAFSALIILMGITAFVFQLSIDMDVLVAFGTTMFYLLISGFPLTYLYQGIRDKSRLVKDSDGWVENNLFLEDNSVEETNDEEKRIPDVENIIKKLS